MREASDYLEKMGNDEDDRQRDFLAGCIESGYLARIEKASR